MLEPELQEATDKFFAGWKERVESRLHVGESQYHGKWHEMDSDQIASELMDEVLDMIAYAIMYRRRLEIEAR